MKISEVKKSHYMIEARFHLTPRQLDILTLLFLELKRSADKIKFGNEQILKTKFEFTTKDLMNFFRLSRDATYELMKILAKNMKGEKARVKQANSQIKKLTLCSYTKYNDGQLILRIDKATADCMLDYSKGFAVVDLTLSLALNGAYEKRLLDLISRFKDRQYTCLLSDFYALMGANPSNYASFTVFRRTVLGKPMKRLIKQSKGMWVATDDRGLGYTLSKAGRSYTNKSRLRLTVKYIKTKVNN